MAIIQVIDTSFNKLMPQKKFHIKNLEIVKIISLIITTGCFIVITKQCLQH